MSTDSSPQTIKVLHYSGEFSYIDHELMVTLNVVSWPDLQPNPNGTQVVTDASELRNLRELLAPGPADGQHEHYTYNHAGAALSALNALEWARLADLLVKLGFKIEQHPGRAPVARIPGYSSSDFG